MPWWASTLAVALAALIGGGTGQLTMGRPDPAYGREMRAAEVKIHALESELARLSRRMSEVESFLCNSMPPAETRARVRDVERAVEKAHPEFQPGQYQWRSPC